MLRVDSSKPLKIVYSLCRHPYLGWLIEPHAIQLNPDGDFSLTHQRLFTNTAPEFEEHLDDTDRQLIKLLEETEQGYLIKRYYKKPIRPVEFFSKVFQQESYDAIRPLVEKKLTRALGLIKKDSLYLMSREGWPVERKLAVADEAATVLFHFRRSAEGTRYFPTIRYKNMRIEFMYRDALVILNEPAWLLLEDTLYYFDEMLEGKKLQPFLNKRYISIPPSAEQAYFERFVCPLIEKHHVFAEGFKIVSERYQASPVLTLTHAQDKAFSLELAFQYGEYVFAAGSSQKVSVRMKESKGDYTFYRIKRSLSWEKTKMELLLSLGLEDCGNGYLALLCQEGGAEEAGEFDLISWLNLHSEQLEAAGFILRQQESGDRFFLGKSSLSLEFKETNDWFDLKAMVTFGPYSIPFIDLKHHILNSIAQYKLPNGEIAIIPQEWFAQYGNLFTLAEKGDGGLRLRKHHIGLVNELAESELASTTMSRKLQKLSTFEEIEDVPAPVHFNGLLRPYQKAGYNWFHFLKQYRFGGCLADDMGLGKTVQTLSLLQKIKEEARAANEPCTSLIIMPTSLIYNWLNEARKFAPQLNILVYTGTFRNREMDSFLQYDLVFCTYGIVRVDAGLMEQVYFNYIILDESQNIKNPSSKAYQAVKRLKSQNKLILSGTPVENSINDLWAQMSFINPGLLGSQTYFQNNFVSPIERKKDEEKARRLQAIIKPFILRRTKRQVAHELPEKTEQVLYCKMSEEQSEYYETTKSEYRNELLRSLEDGTFARSQLQVLQGLTRLRQIANHPALTDSSFQGQAGKFESVIHTLKNVLSEGHKVLMFSQFVRHLDIYRKYFDKHSMRYSYLDGGTQNRGEVVKEFQEDEDIKIFLISLKAGGVGLNLTQADYVFMLDPWWNPAVEQQAVDRTHRIGQTRNVFIYKFITKDTVEEKILALQHRKRAVAESLITVEEDYVKSLSADDIRDIIT